MFVRQHYNLATSGKLGQKAAHGGASGRPSTRDGGRGSARSGGATSSHVSKKSPRA